MRKYYTRIFYAQAINNFKRLSQYSEQPLFFALPTEKKGMAGQSRHPGGYREITWIILIRYHLYHEPLLPDNWFSSRISRDP